MRSAAVAFVLASLGGLAWAAPPDPVAAKALVRVAMPATIDSEASLEYFIGLAGHLLRDDSGKQLALLASQLAALKAQKQALTQKIQAAQSQAAGAQMDALKAQLAKVDLAIKDILVQIERIRDEELREQDDIKRTEETLNRLLDSLANTERKRTEMAGAVTMNSFAKSLSPAKRRETQSRARVALAQLAEARRVRVSRVSTIYEPALHAVAKPLTLK